MRLFSITFTLIVIMGTAKAASRIIEVVDIEEVAGDQSALAVFASDGQIYEVDAKDNRVLKLIISAKNNRQKIAIQLMVSNKVEEILEARNQILDVELITLSTLEKRSSHKNNKGRYNPKLLMSDYITNFSDLRRVNEIFNSQRVDTREDSQCYNRAHVWSWEMRRYSEDGKLVQPGKIWIYFTKKYIRAYRFKWWFHIAPYVKLNGVDMVMDKKFLSGPISTRGWTNFFIQPRTKCRSINRYSKYERKPNKGHCFIMKTSVHYYQPYQIDNLEKGKGPAQTRWQEWELEQAYSDGIGTNIVPNL